MSELPRGSCPNEELWNKFPVCIFLTGVLHPLMLQEVEKTMTDNVSLKFRFTGNKAKAKPIFLPHFDCSVIVFICNF